MERSIGACRVYIAVLDEANKAKQLKDLKPVTTAAYWENGYVWNIFMAGIQRSNKYFNNY